MFAPIGVLEKNPPKQGLKQPMFAPIGLNCVCFREKSTKTRIETKENKEGKLLDEPVLEKNPPKQGLKQKCFDTSFV